MSTKVKKLFATRKRRVRFKLKQRASGKLRLTVFRSNKHVYAQIIDDTIGKTIVSASTLDNEVLSLLNIKGNRANIEGAKAVGKIVAMRANSKQIRCIVFDRGGYIYHGCIKALADEVRAQGLIF